MTDVSLEKIQEIMENTFDLEDLTITRDTTANDIEEWDSLSHIRLIVAIERQFKVKFTNAEIESLANVGELMDTVEAKL